MTKLKKLHLHGNQIATLPEGFWQLSQLEDLALSSMPAFNYLPEACKGLTQLRHLFLSGNGLQHLPEGLTTLTQLEWLFLKDNQLSQLPPGFEKLHNLQRLDLRNNPIANLQTTLEKMDNPPPFTDYGHFYPGNTSQSWKVRTWALI